jgi:drug/metabolite transporter (DMT)-like permease
LILLDAEKPATGFAAAMTALIVGAMAMAISPVFVRLADVGPFASAFWRVALALPALWLWASVEIKAAGGHQRQIWVLPPVILLVGLFFAGDLFFWHLAIVNTTIANATFLATMAPLWVVLGSGLFIGEPVTRATVVGLTVCIAGASVLIGSSYSFSPQNLLGDFYGIMTSLFFGAYFLGVRVARRSFGAGQIVFASTIVTMVVLFVVALIMEPTLVPASAGGVFALLALALVSHAGGQGLLAVALGALSAAFSSLVIFIEAIAAAGFAWLFLAEALNIWQGLGGLLILAGIWLARPRPM